jgi:hypothetical protein
MFQNISKAKEQEDIEDYQEINKDIDFKKDIFHKRYSNIFVYLFCYVL